MASFSSETKVGVFVLLALVLLAYMSFKVGGFDFQKDEGYPLSALFDSAAGLKVQGEVRIAGIPVGAIRDISLEGSKAKVVMYIQPKVALPLDSSAMIRTQGVLGDKYIELVPGTAGLPSLKPGNRLARTVSPADLDRIINRVGEISDDIRQVTATLSSTLGGEQGANQLKAILTNFQEMSGNLAQLTRDNSENLNRMIENMTAFSSDLRTMTEANRDNINAILFSLRETSVNMNRTIVAIQDIAERINRGEGSLGALVNDDTTVKDLNSTLASLRDISSKINEGQGTIGKLINDSTTAEKLDEALTGVNDYLTKDDEFKIYIDYRGDYLMARDELRSTLNVKIQPAEDKFYLLGLVLDDIGTYDRTDKTEVINGVEINTTEETRDRNEIKFNAQLAKRWRNLVVRGGMIESAGGFGLDYYMLDDRLSVTFEGFSGDLDHPAHLRAYASYDFWKLFYATVGYDDFISDQGRESAFVGIGIRFNDDDLKYLLRSVPTGN